MGGNRKERRAAGQKSSKSEAKSTATGFEPSTEIDEDGVEYILQHPDYSGPKGKTLFDLAEERQRELDKGKPAGWNVKKGSNPAGQESSEEEEPLGPLGDAILYSISMAILHVTLDVVVYSQYREDVIWAEIFKRAASALPVFFLLVYLTHVESSNRFPVLRTLLFLFGGIAAGCYLIYSGNKHGYFYVMKAAPPVGTLWIWSVVELNFLYAAISALAVFAYTWWNGLDLF